MKLNYEIPPKPTNHWTTFLLDIHGVSTAGSFSTPRMNFTSACWLENLKGPQWMIGTCWRGVDFVFSEGGFCIQEDQDWI